MSGRQILLLSAIVLLAAGLRVGALEVARPLRLVGDEAYYVLVADNLARGHGHLYVGGMEGASRAWRPPGHAWLLSQLLDADRPAAADVSASQPQLLRMARLEVALGSVLVLLTGLLGRALFDTRTGLVAALIAALYPALVVHSHYLWSEIFFGVLMTGGLLAIVALERRPRLAGAALLGLWFGLATLTREVALVVAGVGALWWLWMAAPAARPRAFAAGAVLFGVAVLVVAPWTLRNQRVFDRLVPVSTVGWFAVGEGNTLESPHWMARRGPAQAAFHRDYFSTRNELARMDLARRHGLERIHSEQPLWLFKKTARNLALWLNPDSVLRTKIRNGAYGDRPPAAIRALLAASIPSYLALVSAAALGVAAAGRGGGRRLGALLFGVLALLHVVTAATPRYRVPWLPLAAVYASHALLVLPRLPQHLGRAPAVAAAIFLLFLFAVCLPYFNVFGGRP